VKSGEEQARVDLGHAELQLDWDAGKLEERWPTGLDTSYLLLRTGVLPSQVAGELGRGRVLEVAAAEAIHSCRLSLQGMESIVVEPSATMLERARRRIAEHGARVALIRGVAETLPFAAGTFDRVLIDSAIDHLGNPELSVREMTRVLKPDGRLVISFVNYGSVSVRLSRMMYRAARLAGWVSPRAHLPWDSPVPIEHTFECTYPVLMRLCEPALDLDRVFGVSIGWLVPGWAAFLRRLPPARALRLLQGLDHLAHRRPALADFIVSVWRPRPAGSPRPPATARDQQFAVQPDEVVYPDKLRAEARYWERWQPGAGPAALARGEGRHVNTAYTGDPDRLWIEDLIARGPFRHAAILGSDGGRYERLWLERRGSERTDLYELSRAVLRALRARLGLGWRGARRGVRFVPADLNFVRLPANQYDVVWSSDCLHHVVNLEHLFGQVATALRPGGLFAFREYVGERRMQYAPRRLERANAVLREIPARWRRTELLEPPPLHRLSPFCAVRSDDILALAEERFELVAKRPAAPLTLLEAAVDLAALEREAPDLAARIHAADADALPPIEVYAVFRKR
jgi:SAM-dependent methyltransferase